jgi:hypothetical protein
LFAADGPGECSDHTQVRIGPGDRRRRDPPVGADEEDGVGALAAGVGVGVDDQRRFVADDLDALLKAIDGRTVKTVAGEKILSTADLAIERI